MERSPILWPISLGPEMTSFTSSTPGRSSQRPAIPFHQHCQLPEVRPITNLTRSGGFPYPHRYPPSPSYRSGWRDSNTPPHPGQARKCCPRTCGCPRRRRRARGLARRPRRSARRDAAGARCRLRDPRPDQPRNFFRRAGPPQQVPLHLVAAVDAVEVQLLFRLDSFCRHHQLE